MNTSMSIYYRYWIYSATQEQLRQQVAGNNARFGTVNVNGVNKRYTDMITDMDKAPADAIVVAKGDMRKIKFTHP